jgi:hypothetical protein
MKENDDTETRRYDKVVIRCMVCGHKHDGATINVPKLRSRTSIRSIAWHDARQVQSKVLRPVVWLSKQKYFLQPYSGLRLCPLLVQRTDFSCQLSATASCVVSLSWCTIAGKQLQQALAFAAEDG